ncbi:Beige/BEACH domain containing protein [Entamoeba histolytica HM-3:IMSS]|uniref:Beige/BEACH domain containing protein n=2 Tax=Entamoeba histolytica TaxID=5759 RepID=M7X8S6_ENTHI|nr:Beige/BEACH domain containing protein [Entamoeba histolytica HM-3:IMSS]
MSEEKKVLTEEQISMIEKIEINGKNQNLTNQNEIEIIINKCLNEGDRYLSVVNKLLSDSEILSHYRENENGMKLVMNMVIKSINDFMKSDGKENINNIKNKLSISWICGAVKGAKLYKINNEENIEIFNKFLTFILNRNKREEATIINGIVMNIYTSQVIQNDNSCNFFEEILNKFGVLEEYAEMDDIIFYEYQCGLAMMLFTMIGRNELFRYRGIVQHKYIEFFNFILKRNSVLKEIVSYEKFIEPIRLDLESLPLFIHMLKIFIQCEQINECNKVFNEFCHSLLLFQGRQKLLLPINLLEYLLNPLLIQFIKMPWYSKLILNTINEPLHSALISSNIKLREEVFKLITQIELKEVTEPFLQLATFYLHSTTENGLFEYMTFVNIASRNNNEIAKKAVIILINNVFNGEEIPNVKEDFYNVVISLIPLSFDEEYIQLIFKLLRITWKNKKNKKVFNYFINEFSNKLMELKQFYILIIKELIQSISSSSINEMYKIDNVSIIHYPKLLPVIINFMSLKICPLDLFLSIEKLFISFNLNLYYVSKYCSCQIINLITQNDPSLITEQLQQLLEIILLYSSLPQAGKQLTKALEEGKGKNTIIKLIYKLLSSQLQKPTYSIHFIGSPLIYSQSLTIQFKSTTIVFCFSYSLESESKQCIFNFIGEGNSLTLYLENNSLLLVFNENTLNELKISFNYILHPKVWYLIFINFELKNTLPIIHLIIYNNSINPLFEQNIEYKLKDNYLSSNKNYIGTSFKSKFPFYGEFSFFSIYSICLNPIDILLTQTQGFDILEHLQTNKRIFYISPLNIVKENNSNNDTTTITNNKYLIFYKNSKTLQTISGNNIKLCICQSLQNSLHQSNFLPRFFYFVRSLERTQFIDIFKLNARANNPVFLLLSFISRCVIGSQEMKEDFINIKGALLLESIISHSTPVFVIPAIFDQFQKLAEYFEKDIETYEIFQSILFDFRLWTPFSFTFQKYVLQKVVQLMKGNNRYMQYLSDLLILYFQPEFPSNLKLHTKMIRKLSINEINELRNFIWKSMGDCIQPNKQTLQPFISTLNIIKNDNIFIEGFIMLLKSINYSSKWIEIFISYLCQELLNLLFKFKYTIKALIFECIGKFLEFVDSKFPYFQNISQTIQLTISIEGIFTLEELRVFQNYPIKITELINIQEIYLNIFQYSTNEVADKLTIFWISQPKNLIQICNGKEINFKIVESLINGIKGDFKRLRTIGLLLKRSLTNESLRNYENISKLYLLFIKVDECSGEYALLPDLLFNISKALEEKKSEKGLKALVMCTNLFLTKLLQTDTPRVFTIESIIPFFEKYKDNSYVKKALRKMRIIRAIQVTENTNEIVQLKDNKKEVLAMYGVYCMDRIMITKVLDVRERLVQLFLNISKIFYDDLIKEIKNYQNGSENEREEMIDLLINGKSNHLEEIINGVIFSKVRRILSGYASNILLDDEEYRAICNDEINLIAGKKKENKENTLCGFIGNEVRNNCEEKRIEELKEKLNKEIELLDRKYKKFDGKMMNEINGIPKYWQIESIEIDGMKGNFKGNEMIDLHKEALVYSSERKDKEIEMDNESFIIKKMNSHNVFIEQYCDKEEINYSQQIIFEMNCELITEKAFMKIKDFQKPWTLNGMIKVIDNILIFNENNNNNNNTTNKPIIKKYNINNIEEILPRRYLMKYEGIEIFFMNGKSMYIIFNNKKNMIKVFTLLRKISGLNEFNLNNLIQQSLKKWQNGEISNFEYLMLLNRYSSRSYHDLTQYPIFPWILKDYKSTSLNLNDENIYRDLSLPIPCINPERFKIDQEKFNQLFGENGIQKDQIPYYYTTFYSACDYVLFFLIRCEPYTTMFIKMNNGHFDRPERMFYSIEHSWKTCMSSTQCNIELIPEFYYLPEFLINENHFNFGILPDTKQQVDDVSLPQWAKTPEEFISLHRLALESPYVSSHLHQWIDLIFGYKSTGNEALNAKNLYYPTAYEDNYDPNQMDKNELELFLQRHMFGGQVPVQLFNKPHPPRMFIQSNTINQIIDKLDIGKIIESIQINNDDIMVIGDKGIFKISIDTNNHLKINGNIQINKPNYIHIERNKCCFTSDGKYLFIASKEDNNIHVYQIDNGKEVLCLKLHLNTISYLSIIRNKKYDYLITGSKDSTLFITKINSKTPLSLGKIKIITSHEGEIILSKYDIHNDLLATICKKGIITLTRLSSMKIVLKFNIDNPINDLTFCDNKLFIVTTTNLLCYSLKGKLLSEIEETCDFILPLFNSSNICCISDDLITFHNSYNLSQWSSNEEILINEKICSLFIINHSIWIYTISGNIVRLIQKQPITL